MSAASGARLSRLHVALLATTGLFLAAAPFSGSAGLRVWMLVLSAIAVGILFRRGERPPPGSWPRTAIAAFAAWALLATASLAWSVRPEYTAGELRAEIVYGTFAVGVFFLAAFDAARWPVWRWALIAGALAVLAFENLQAALGVRLTRHAFAEHAGPWSTHLVLVAPLVMSLAWPRPWGGGRGAWVAIAGLLLLFAAAWQSGNRMVWVALGLQLGLLALLGRALAIDPGRLRALRIAAIACVAVVGLALLLAVQDRIAVWQPGASVAESLGDDVRPRIWALAWQQFQERPWLGHGFGREILAATFEPATPGLPGHPRILHAHNVFLDVLLQLGVAGLAVLVILLAGLALQYRAFLHDRSIAPLGVLGLLVLAGFVAKGMTDDFLHRHNALVFWALNAMLVGLGRFHRARPAPVVVPVPEAPRVDFTCNVCGHSNRGVLLALVENREAQSCEGCRSSLRMRSLMYLLSLELYGKPLTLPQFPADPSITGIGMSDWDGYALPLARKLGYVNTYYHAEPRLDIADVPAELLGRHRFLISSDVFEHIPHFALDAAFRNSRRLLRDDGFFLFTVPFLKQPETREHFPRLHDFAIEERDGRRVLRNRTVEGEEEVFEDLVFHGGDGMTLEMRMFSEADLRRRLAAAGFSSVTVHAEHYPPFGILWPMDWAVPMVARA